ncbi:hypothetical protein BDV36DRAFT_294405 [Aspergillus pseudocaelatus]|uniref:DNA2/NAM7 helicase helicase domain-containing protein n=1 Tax=Aspergillus pseudocaelatus TaxID=1825620 RepID=A0ABQ6WPV5_9EURO|nr:hypothetical protein BDV36DRAFT_294405 [Aspergillus pseudocaelatus]
MPDYPAAYVQALRAARLTTRSTHEDIALLDATNGRPHSCTWSNAGEHRAFVEYFTQYQNGDLDPETILQFRTATRALRESVLKRADVVVSTLFAAGQHSLYSVVRPTVIAVDECAKSFETEPWSASPVDVVVFKFYEKRTLRARAVRSRQLSLSNLT